MDSLTHVVLGAVTGEIIAGKRYGRRAMLWGAVAQSFPDIDVFASLWLSPVDNVIFHRGPLHSLLVNVIVAMIFSAIIARWSRKPEQWKSIFLFLIIQFYLHLLMDVFNAYGVGLLEPFIHEKYSLNSMFVVDVFFSFWLVIASVILLFIKGKRVRRKIALTGLFLSILYLTSAIANRMIVSAAVRQMVAKENIRSDEVLITPTPLNSWLWFVAVRDGDKGFYMNYVSVFHPDDGDSFHYIPSGGELRQSIKDQKTLRKLVEFSSGFYTLGRRNDQIIFNDLCFGQISGWNDPDAEFAFYYYLDDTGDNTYVMQRGRFTKWNKETINSLFRKIFSHG